MKISRWLAAFLIASWTLNVALLVAYYLKTTYPPGASRYAPSCPDPMAARFCIPGEVRDNFRAEVSPLHEAQSRLIMDVSSAFAADELDTVLLTELSDSLNVVRCELQRKLFRHLYRLHGELPPEARYRLSKRISRMMNGHMQGPAGKRQQRFHRRLIPDENKK